jgi:hypothetical protein
VPHAPITGDVSSITLVETRTQKGGEAAGDWTPQDNSAPITVCVDRDDAIEVGRIAYRISYTDSDGTTQTIEDSFDVPPLLTPQVSDPGGSTSGTPGDGLLPFIVNTGEPYVLGQHEDDYEIVDCGTIRRNLRKSAFLVGQSDVRVAGASTAYLDLGYTYATGAITIDDIVGYLGVKVPLKAVGQAVSIPVEVAADLSDVRLVAVMKGGDGVEAPEVMNFLVSATAVAPPPTDGEDTPDPPPPPPDALPEGSWGDVILDLNSGTEDDFADLAREVPWTDDSPTGADGTTTTGASGAERHATGFAGGDQPFARLKPSDYYFVSPNSYGGEETMYVLGVFTSGAGVGNVGDNEAAHIIGMPTGLGGENSWLRLQGDGTLYFLGGVSVFGGVEAFGSIVVTDGEPHIIRLVHVLASGLVQVWVDGVLDIEINGAPELTHVWSSTIYVGGNLGAHPNKITADINRIVRYNKGHTVDAGGLNAPEAVIVAGGTLGEGAGGGGVGGGGGSGLVGFGSDTAAGRGGPVYRVTNLNDTGPGSLRDACSRSGARTIVFEVSGTITLTSKIAIANGDLTIAGQTAPAPGILLKGHGLSIRNTSDVLVHHIRSRVGGYVAGENPNEDCFEVIGGRRVVFDHCSGSWSIDENASTWYWGSDGAPVASEDITWVDCFLGENQGSGALLVGQHTKRFSMIRCFLISNDDRNPYFKGDTSGVVVNCVIYNWGQNPGAYLANPDGLAGETLVAIVGNVFKKGPRSLNHAMQFYANCKPGSLLYVDDNSKSDVNGGLPPVDPWSLVNNLFGAPGVASSAPLWPDGLTALPNASVVAAVLDQAGAWASSRDAVDARFVTEYNAGTGQHLQSETYPGGATLASVGGFPTLAANSRTMEDAGMPADPTLDSDSDGITDLEDWLKDMADTAAGV